MSRRRTRRAEAPSLPCLTIARTPANDARVIVDAFVSTPVLVQLLADRGAMVREHRAELRAVLQQLTGHLAAMVERAGGERAAGAPTAASVATAPRPAERERSARRAAARRAIPAAPDEQAVAAWDGDPMLR